MTEPNKSGPNAVVDFKPLMNVAIQGANTYIRVRDGGDNPEGGPPPKPPETRFNALIDEVRGRLQSTTPAGSKPNELAIAETVDQVVNQRITYRNERFDNWQTGADTAARGSGDCDDYAILKAEMMVRMGVPPERVGVMILGVKDPKANPNVPNHAVCTYTDEKGQVYVLNDPKSSERSPMMKLEDYLKDQHGISGGAYLTPVGTMRIDSGKFEWDSRLASNGTMPVAAMQVPEKKPPTLAELDKLPGLRDAVINVVANKFDPPISQQMAQDGLQQSPRDFLNALKDAIQNNRFPAGFSDDDKKIVQLYANALSSELDKAKPEVTTAKSDPTIKSKAEELLAELKTGKANFVTMNNAAPTTPATPEAAQPVEMTAKSAPIQPATGGAFKA